MRHVILGSNTLVGSSIIRVLESLDEPDIIACNPMATLPDSISGKNVTVVKADTIDPYSLMEVLQEEDIVYNTQILENEDAISEDADLQHIIGWINLLGIATHRKVGKIICYTPQLLGWKVIPNSTEESSFQKSSSYHKSIQELIRITKLYWDGEDFGWSGDSIQDLLSKNQSPSEEEDNNEESVGSGPVPQSSGPTPPNIEGPQAPVGLPTPPVVTAKPSDETESESEEVLVDDEDQVEERIPVLIVRIARLFGPFDRDVTETFCRAVRLQRISVVGKINAPISWCNPNDAGRAMIMLSDKDIEQGQFLINGFNATPIEILESLDRVNHSSIKMKRQLLIIRKFKHYMLNALGKVGINYHSQYSKLVRLNVTQLFDDKLAQTTWDWTPRWDLDSTAKEAFNWYVNHVL
ncbi:MAG: hypothetical protein ACW98K_01295 [Candidatus Kariarchaeaceae archaeon]|jgi:hypothetical protein